MSVNSPVVRRLGLPTNPSRHADPEIRRAYWRQLKRNERDRKVKAAQQTANRCPVRYGRGTCGGVLEITTDRIGRTLTTCARCERIASGRCVDCPRPIAGNRARGAIRCQPCRVRVWKAQLKANAAKDIERTRRYRRKSARKRWKALTEAAVSRDPVRRAEALATLEAIRKAQRDRRAAAKAAREAANAAQAPSHTRNRAPLQNAARPRAA